MFTGGTVDAVYALAYAINQVLGNGIGPTNPAFGSSVATAMYSVSFTGALGNVSFDSNGNLINPSN